MIVLGIDPGQTTGVVCLVNGEVDFTQEVPWDLRLSSFCDMFKVMRPDLIAVESFHLYPHRAQSQIGSIFPSVEVIGIVQAFAWTFFWDVPIVWQTASMIKLVAILPEHQRLVKHSEHLQDAYKHTRLAYEHALMN